MTHQLRLAVVGITLYFAAGCTEVLGNLSQRGQEETIGTEPQ